MGGLFGYGVFARVCVGMLDVCVCVKTVGVLVRANPNTAAGCVGAVIWYLRCRGAIYAALGLVSIRGCVLG